MCIHLVPLVESCHHYLNVAINLTVVALHSSWKIVTLEELNSGRRHTVPCNNRAKARPGRKKSSGDHKLIIKEQSILSMAQDCEESVAFIYWFSVVLLLNA